MSDFCTWGKHTSAFMLELCGINRVLWEGLVHPVNSSVLGWILFHQQQKSSSLDTLIVSGYIIVFTNPAACDIFAFRVAWLRDSFPQDYCSASVSVTLLSVNISKKEPEKMLKGLEGNILHFLENFNQCYTTNLAVLKRWSWECSHGGCQGIDSLDSLGQKTPLRSSAHVFCRLTDEWVLQKPQIHTWPTLYQPQIPPTDTSKHSRHQERGCLWEPEFHLWDHKGNVFGEQESVSSSVLVMMPWTAEREVQYTATESGFVHPWK